MPAIGERLGVTVERDVLTFRIFSANATRIDLYLYDTKVGAEEKLAKTLSAGAGSIWSVSLPLDEIRRGGISSTIYYGYRAWGGNWPFDSAWRKGSAAGFITDVDNAGNRFNPNKLLIDPYAREISHDPAPSLSGIDPNEYSYEYYSGDSSRNLDTGRIAPKGIAFLGDDTTSTGTKPDWPLKDDIIYEVHLRGFTKADHSIDDGFRGTFKGAGLKASYLKKLGVTAVEFLPVFDFADEQNDDGNPLGDNYWGYMTLNFFSPNRRYSSDNSPGGPTREFKEMVAAFHDKGIKVFLDVAFNHTGEGLLRRTTEQDQSRHMDEMQYPDHACILSFRGIDNASYYQVRSNPALDGDRTSIRYEDNSGCGPNLRVTHPVVREFVMDALKYWSREMGVDGFRFDLAPVLGNERDGGFEFGTSKPENLLNRMVFELPARSVDQGKGVDLIAEPWMVKGDPAYFLGDFPDGWAEWNDRFRGGFRRAENKLGVDGVAPGTLANVFAGSEKQMRGEKGDKKKQNPAPWNSINYISSHDEYILRDLYSFTNENNPGDICWDHGGDPFLQRQAVRNGLAILMLSAGVPMFCGGDEFFRSQNGERHVVAIDNDSVYLQWDRVAMEESGAYQGSDIPDEIRIYRFAQQVIGFRNAHAALRPAEYFLGKDPGTGLKDIAWYRADGGELGEWDPYMGYAGNNFLGFRVDGKGVNDPDSSIYVGYNKGESGVDVTLPGNRPGEQWYRVCDTAAWMEPQGNWESEGSRIDGKYYMHGRSITLFVER
jgi:isoamylase